MRILISLVTCFFGFASVAQAARISSPAIFAAHTQRTAQCIVFNSGTEPVDVTMKILDESGRLVSGGATFLLRPGVIVPISAFIDFGVAYVCTVDAASLPSLRAVLVISELHILDGRFYDRPIRTVPLR
jgi:hypothetical protein